MSRGLSRGPCDTRLLQDARRWHVSAPVDAVAYAFSWVPPLAVLATFGELYVVRATVFVGVNVISEVHRCWTFGYAFPAAEVRRRSQARFVVLPLVLLTCVLACPLLLATDRRRALFGPALSFSMVLEGLSIVAGAWNIYHVLAQKYGLLRLYAGKARRAASREVDRALTFAPLLLVPAWLLPQEAPALRRAYPPSPPAVTAALDALTRARTPLLVLALTTAAFAIGCFLLAEWRENRLTNRPRLTLAAGTVLLCASFFFVRPLYAYMAFAFSHAVEYMVFVAAFLHRRAEHEDDRLSRLARRPVVSYATWILGLSTLFFFAGPWIQTLRPQFHWQLFGGDGPDDWIRPWILFSSLLHFYYDGILWKVRSVEIARNL